MASSRIPWVLALCACADVFSTETAPLHNTGTTTSAVGTHAANTLTTTSTVHTSNPSSGGDDVYDDDVSSSNCVSLQRCLNRTHCRRCIAAINSSTAVHSAEAYVRLGSAGIRAYQRAFFEALITSNSCQPSVTPLEQLVGALSNLELTGPCINAYGMVVANCPIAEGVCFFEATCRECLTNLFAAPSNLKDSVLQSRTCEAVESDDWPVPNACNAFPECTYHKQLCNDSAACIDGLSILRDGHGGRAAEKVHTGPSAARLDSVVTRCAVGSAAACDYWQHRCASDSDCATCLAVINLARGSASILTTFARNCSIVIGSTANTYIGGIMSNCPSTSSCTRASVTCALRFGAAKCNGCLNRSVTYNSTQGNPYCLEVVQSYGIQRACQGCSDSVKQINAVVLATAMIGGLSASICLLVVVTIWAHGRTRRSMRDRIVLGLLSTNAVYSMANTVPVSALQDEGLHCGQLALSFDVVRAGRAIWFGGKYGIVAFELFIISASLQALLRGRANVSAAVEVGVHVICVGVAFAAFAAFYTECDRINRAGYNYSTTTEALTNAYSHLGMTDDLDDDEPFVEASIRFEAGRAAYDELVRELLLAWDVLVGVAITLWFGLRLLYWLLLRRIREDAAAIARAQAEDEWAGTRQSGWTLQLQMIEDRRHAFNEIAGPLEPYIVVFALFAVPAVLMSTTWCQSQSGADTTGSAAAVTTVGSGVDEITYGMCDVWCEFALAFRSLCTVAIYLLPQDRRAEVRNLGVTCRNVRIRLAHICTPRQPAYTPLSPADNMYEMVRLSSGRVSPSQSSESGEQLQLGRKWRICEEDLDYEQELGRGTFGTVWQAKHLPTETVVAVKVLSGGLLDDEGDPIDPDADVAFNNECKSLLRVTSPHLIQFIGYTTSSTGMASIVTELMRGGSLEDVLHDSAVALPWRTRVSIALQIALGMEHLHAVPLVHRDLKSGNVLLDEQRRVAKVCDFGLTKKLRPATERIEYSPFTGTIRQHSMCTGAIPRDQYAPALATSLQLSVVDAHGTMTKAAGTLLWMAPEIFRGDLRYGLAVDVYSFGVVLWELATRELPWTELGGLEHMAEFLQQLTLALQTGARPTVSSDVQTRHFDFVAVMEHCWVSDPAQRPLFSQVSADLAKCLRTYV